MLNSHGEGQSLVLDSDFFLTWMPIIFGTSEVKLTGKHGNGEAEKNININILWFIKLLFCIVYKA